MARFSSCGCCWCSLPLSVGTTSGITRDYIFVGGQRIAFVPLSSGNAYYYLSDHLGSDTVVASGDGKTIQWEGEFFPFGAQRTVITNLADNPYEFTGYEYDSGTGYNYAVARFDAGRWGRFLSPDPYLGSMNVTSPQSLNRYTYVQNDPTDFIDPLGLDTKLLVVGNCLVQESRYGNELTHKEDVTTTVLFCGSPGGGASGGAGNAPPPAKQPCIQPTAIQRAGIPIQRAVAKLTGKTMLAGLNLSRGVGFGKAIGAYGSVSAQIAVSPNGNAAYLISWSAPALPTGIGTYPILTPAGPKGSGVLVGSQFGFSNATDPSQLQGRGVDASGSVAAGFGMGVDVSTDLSTYTVNLTFGFGAGGRAGAGALSSTTVVPICQ